jgi:ElaB/YqjD/DUF883 family membrane-anchored ribosome-binding protein
MSTVTNSMRETAKDAREAVRETGKAASAASGDIQNDLQALRDDVAKLGRQVGDILSNTGNVALKRAKSSLDNVMSDAGDKGREAVDAVREVSDGLVSAIDDSLKRRPYTTLALVAGLGFLFGATWRR